MAAPARSDLEPGGRERVWTVDDPDLPEKGWDVVDGRLHRQPMTTNRHDTLSGRLVVALAAQLPPGWEPVGPFMLRLGSDVRVPDAGVVRRPPTASPPLQNGFDPVDVALAVEVVSPGSRKTDRLFKPAEYAEAGVLAYWRVETEPEVVVHVHRLVDGAYRAVQQVRGVEQVEDPFALVLDVAALDD